jgi:hypothetical protein
VTLALLAQEFLDFRLLLKLCLFEVLEPLARRLLPFREERLDGIGRPGFQRGIGSQALCNLAFDPPGAPVRVDVNLQAVAIDFERAQRGVVPLLVQAVAPFCSTVW